jgi:hypothetical protein
MTHARDFGDSFDPAGAAKRPVTGLCSRKDGHRQHGMHLLDNFDFGSLGCIVSLIVQVAHN